jgi:putative ABC transport system permease protein
MSGHVRFFRRLVRVLFPESFRVDYGSELERTFHAQQRDAEQQGGGRAIVRLWWETLVDLIRTAPREHVGQLRQDVLYALRMMARTPSFTAIALVTLAVGIGANTAIFSAVNAVLVRPLPYADADSLAMLWNHWPGSEKSALSYPELLDFRERLRTVHVAAWGTGSANLIGRGEPERLLVAEVTPNLLDVLGVRPALGRTFRAEEEQRGRGFSVILSDELWRRRFTSDPAIIGRSVTLDREVLTVVGVLPPGFVMPHDFGGLERTEAIVPLTVDVSAPRDQRGTHFLRSAARLRSDHSMPQAQAEIDATTRAWDREYPGEYDPQYGATLWPVRTDISGDVRPALLVLLGAVSLVLLVACANVANLLLARGQVRAREIAVRKAIGASQARLVRQVITESLVLAGAAAAGGVALAHWLTTIMVRTAPDIPRIDEVRLDMTVLAFTAIVSVVTAVIFGSLPAMELARRDAHLHLYADRSTRSPLRHAVRGMLVTAQVALALVLLVGAALLIQSFTKLLRAPSGINPEQVLTLQVSLPAQGYRERDLVVRFYEQLLDRLRSTTGVRSAGGVSNLPLNDPIGDWDFYLPGETPSDQGSDRAADWQVITPGFLEAMGVPLVRGRFPAAADTADAPAVVVVNETLARTYFAGRDPIGLQIRMSGRDRSWMTIVGVCADVRHDGLDTPANAQVYMPHAQFKPFWSDTTVRSLALAIRTTAEPLSLASIVRERVRELDPTLPISQVMTMETVVQRSVASRRLQMLLLTVFAAIALVLASIGTYGVLAYHVTERTREIGVRMALGARAADIVRLVVREGMVPASIGVLLGVAGAMAVSRLLDTLLFETSAADPVTFGATAVVLLTAAFLACVVPARRATRIEPSMALRAE